MGSEAPVSLKLSKNRMSPLGVKSFRQFVLIKMIYAKGC